ncbi:MAG: hypothetical protein ACRDHD_00375 [Candidatus Limnocylindria bacterium]
MSVSDPAQKPSRLGGLPIYPAVLAFTFVLAAFIDADVNLHAAVRPMVLVVVGVAVVTLLLSFAIGPLWGGIATGVIVLVGRSGTLVHGALALLLVALVAAAYVLARRIWRHSDALRHPTPLLNTLSIALLAVTVVSAAVDGSLGRIDVRQGAPASALEADLTRAPGERPDVYILLLDGYPRADTIGRLFGGDNRAFLGSLQRLGFDVSGSASSNYMYTGPTFTSMFHMQYVDDVARLGEVEVPFGVSLRSSINNNPVWDTFRAHGYQVVTVKGPWEHEAMRSSDVFCGDSINDFELFLVRTTLAGSALESLASGLEADQHRAAVNEAFDCLGRMDGLTAEPKLVFVHIGGPHLPIVFDESGGPADPEVFAHTRQELALSDAEFADAYMDQLRYLNGRVLDAASELANRPDEPVLVVMSDHGSEAALNWTDGSRSDLAERFGILFAARTPGHPQLFDCNITPIEVFPALLNTYLDEDLPTPEPRHFVSSVNDKLGFQEVADPDGDVNCAQ